MDVAIVGCGFVSYLYGGTLRNYPSLRVVGAYDRDAARAAQWCRRFGGTPFASLQDVLNSDARLIVNLTNPDSHFEVSEACLRRGRHVYTEKPLARTTDAARELQKLAASANLFFGCAPCSLLGESAQTLWHAVRNGVVGKIHTAYVSMSLPAMTNKGGAAWASSQRLGGIAAEYAKSLQFPVDWPYEDEFAVGPAVEHTAYALKWLTSWFGPVTRLVNYSSTRLPQKIGWNHLDGSLHRFAASSADLYVSCLTLEDDVEVVLINSWAMSLDLRFALHGSEGSLEVESQWDFAAPVRVKRAGTFMPPDEYVYPHVAPTRFRRNYPPGYRVNMDYARGIARLAAAIEAGRVDRHVCRLDQELHIQDVTDRIAHTRESVESIRTSFTTRPEPLPLPTHIGVGFVGEAAEAALLRRALQEDSALHFVDNPTGTLEALLCDERVDVIFNRAPPAQHVAVTRASLGAGKHVLVDMPTSAPIANLEAIRSLAGRTGVRVGIRTDTQQLCVPPRELQSLRDGHLGELRHIRADVTESQLNEALAVAIGLLGRAWTLADEGSGTLKIVFASGADMVLQLHSLPANCEQGTLQIEGSRGSVKFSAAEAAHEDRMPGIDDLRDLCAALCTGTPHRCSLDRAIALGEALKLVTDVLDTRRPGRSATAAVLCSWL